MREIGVVVGSVAMVRVQPGVRERHSWFLACCCWSTSRRVRMSHLARLCAMFVCVCARIRWSSPNPLRDPSSHHPSLLVAALVLRHRHPLPYIDTMLQFVV